jgi:hypothetical protein
MSVKGFEEHTSKITEDEIKLAHRLIPAFKKRTSSNPILAVDICKAVNETMNIDFKLTEVRLRRIVNYYRVNAILPIISTKKGYYTSNDVLEIRDCIDSLTQRATSILDSAFGMEKFIKNNL